MTTIKRLLLFTLFIACTCISIFAAEPDFRVGDLYYKVDSWEGRTCIVWGPGEVNYWDYRSNGPSGDIEISKYVTYNGVEFKVVKIQGFDNSDRESPFYGNDNITSVSIPSTVEAIGSMAFAGCSNLRTVDMSGGRKLGAYAFHGCANLITVYLPYDLEYIGYKAFYGCINLSSHIRISDDCKYIGEQAFDKCHYLSSVYIEDGSAPLKLYPKTFNGGENIYVGRQLIDGDERRSQENGSYALIYTFKHITFGNMVTILPKFYTISQYNLEKRYDTDCLQTLTIASSVKTIPNLAQDFIRIKALFMESSTPPVAEGFNVNAFLNTIVYVPKGSVSAYRSAPVWKNFLRIVEFDESQKEVQPVLDLEVSGWENGEAYVDLGLPSGVLWASCNLGADYPWEAGDYYAWGETAPKHEYTYENYKHCVYYDSCKYFNENMYPESSEDSYSLDFLRILPPEDDAASVNWGGNWRMPTAFEWAELKEQCKWTWLPYSFGYKVVGPNGNAIFLPMAGIYSGNKLNNESSFVGFYNYKGYIAKGVGRYWASTYWYYGCYYIEGTGIDIADCIGLHPWNSIYDFTVEEPYSGLSIRPVWSSTSAKESLRESIINLDKE